MYVISPRQKRQNLLVVKSTFRSSTGILGASVSLPSEQTYVSLRSS